MTGKTFYDISDDTTAIAVNLSNCLYIKKSSRAVHFDSEEITYVIEFYMVDGDTTITKNFPDLTDRDVAYAGCLMVVN